MKQSKLDVFSQEKHFNSKDEKNLGCTMSISRVRMVDFISEESSIAFEKEYIKRARELVPNALNLILTRTGPESLLNIAVYRNQEDVDSSFKATEDFMAN